MKTRWHMESRKYWIMVEHTDRTVLEEIRRKDTRFKRCRIKSVLQAYPSRIQLGTIYQLT